MGSQQTGTQTVQQRSDPWAGAQPYLTGGHLPVPGSGGVSGGAGGQPGMLSRMTPGLSGRIPPGATSVPGRAATPTVTGVLPEAERIYRESVANPFNADELAAMEAMRGRVGRDYSLLGTGGDYLGSAARGDYLGQQNFMDAYGEGILNEIDSRFGRANRTGSAYASQSAAKGLTQAAAPLYAQERQLQQQAALALPGFEAARYGLLDSDINALLQAGAMQQGRPGQNLLNYANVVNSAAGQGGTSSSSQPLYSNPVAGGLGGALAGAQLAPLLGLGGPLGAGLGLGLGLLGG